MATSQLTCCEREDGSKYWHKCGCPQATFDCESEQFNLVLCGHSEFNNSQNDYPPSQPPKKYLRATNSGYGQWVDCPDCSPVRILEKGIFSNATREYTFNNGNCVEPSDTVLFDARSEFFPGCGDIETTYSNASYVGQFVSSRTTRSSNSNVISAMCPGQNGTQEVVGTYACVLDFEDTEADAEARATGVAGTSCSSRWETRNTEFDWIKRTSGYKIECTSLIVGLEYTVTPAIRRRTAQDDGSGTWEDVTVTPVDFTATSDTETIDNGAGDFIPLDSIQGWEYEITGVNIEKKV